MFALHSADGFEDVIKAFEHESSQLLQLSLLILDGPVCSVQLLFVVGVNFPQIVECFNHMHLLALEHFDYMFCLLFEELKRLLSCTFLHVLGFEFHGLLHHFQFLCRF